MVLMQYEETALNFIPVYLPIVVEPQVLDYGQYSTVGLYQLDLKKKSHLLDVESF